LTNYERAGFPGAGLDFDLGKIHAAIEKLDYPHRKYKSIHIAGTKGKGSVSSFCSSILEEAGCRVGLFTSPHLTSVRERIKINSEAISKTDFADSLESLKKYIGLHKGPEEFTFFEVITLMAMFYFSIREVDYAVFEVGMGGRLDATNVIDAEVCGITPVSYDHTQILGKKIEEIAGEKAAIIKNGTHCVSSPQRDPVLGVIKEKCLKKNAILSVVGEDITHKVIHLGDTGSEFNIFTKQAEYKACRTSMIGDFQPSNCAVAVGICEQILSDEKIKGQAPKTEIFKRGIEKTFVPGRMEILSRRPLVVLDGAQNEESAKRLKDSVEKIFRYNKLILVLGLSKDKDIKGVCRWLVPLADEIVLTKASVDRACDPLLIRGYVKGKPVKITGSSKEAMGAAFSKAGKGDMILVTGSFFVIGEVKQLIQGKDE
jgi:dihydrofolate synthase/folylpolyglutamate synthase